jgi:hypothetical protein
MLRILFNRLPGDSFYTSINKPFVLSYKNTIVRFTVGRNIIIEGSVKNAAKAIFNFMIDHRNLYESKENMPIGYSVNGVTFDWGRDFNIEYDPYIAAGIPESFIKIKEEFDKLKKLLVFR